MKEESWYFGVVREGGCYRIVAAGPTEGRVRRAMLDQTMPTLVVTRDDLPALGVGESEWHRWLPEAQEGQAAAQAEG